MKILKSNFSPLLFEKIPTFGWCLEIKMNEFCKRKFCLLEKYADLNQAVTFCIIDYLYVNSRILFLLLI